LFSAASAVLLPVLVTFLTAQATGATPKKKPPAAPAKPSAGELTDPFAAPKQKPPAVPAKPSAEGPDNPFSVGPPDDLSDTVPAIDLPPWEKYKPPAARPARKAQPPTPAKAAVSSVVGGERAIREALREPTSLQFVETPLQDVIDYLREKHHIEIQLDKKELESMSIGPDTLVTRSLRGISLRSALKLMLDEMGLKFVIHNEVLLITSPTKSESDEFLVTKMYPVADLVIPIQDHPYAGGLLPNGLEPTSPGGPGGSGQVGPFVVSVIPVVGPAAAKPTTVRVADFDSLIELITTTVAPKSWDCNGGQGPIAVYPPDLSLVVSQTQEVHGEIAALLAKLRAQRRAITPTVVIDLQWLWLDTTRYGRLLGGKPPAAGQISLPVDAQILDEVARRAPGFRGRAVCINGQLVHLASGDRRSVISGATPATGTTLSQPPAAGAGGMSGMGGGFFEVPAEQKAAPPGDFICPVPSLVAGAEKAAWTAGGKPPPTPAGGQPVQQPATAQQPPAASPAVIQTQAVYQPVVEVPNVGVMVEVRPNIAPPAADTALLDVQCFVTRWGKPAPPARVGGPGSASCPVDRVNMPAVDLAATARVPLGKPVLLGAVTFAPAGGAGLDKATDTPVQLCLIATTSIAADAKKPAKK
jgi:hypothetical protein